MEESQNSKSAKKDLVIGGRPFAPGESGTVNLPIGHLITHEMVSMPVHVFRGRKSGPSLFVSAAIHGDETNGVQISRHLMASGSLKRLKGDLLIVPVVNLLAFMARSRYLPDRRDLNRLFPGSATGSFGARLARVFYQEVVKNCQYGIDLHTGAVNRPNLPQIRIDRSVEGILEVARAFQAPIIINSPSREGSLRDLMAKSGRMIMLYEAGEALSLDRGSVRVGVRGVLSVMRYLEMLPPDRHPRKGRSSVLATTSSWERAPRGGILTPLIEMGKAVEVGSLLGSIGDPFTAQETQMYSSVDGIVIGRAKQAVVDEGDGVFHIASTRDPEKAERQIGRSGEELDETFDQPVFDDPMTD